MSIKHITTLFLFVLTLNVQANVQDVYDDWFDQLGGYTAPGSFETGMANGYFGGRFTVKSPITSVTVANFSPPSVSAGCGGVDFFGGSFSFIDSEQFEELLRNVSQNAKGYLFHLLLDNVFPEGSKIIELIQKKIQQLNEFMGNSCQLAQGIVDGGIDAFSDLKDKEYSAMAVASDAVGDLGESITNNVWQPVKEAAKDDWDTIWDNKEAGKGCDDLAKEGKNVLPDTYNVFWFLMICKKYDTAWEGEYGIEMVETLMSLYGTSIIITTRTSSEKSVVGGTPRVAHVIPSISTLLYGPDVPHIKCKTYPYDPYSSIDKHDAMGCLDTEISNEPVDSFITKMEVLLNGDGTSGNRGIIDLIRNDRGAGMSEEQKNALTALGPFVSNIRNITLKNPVQAQKFIEKAIIPMAVYALEDMIKNAYTLISSAISISSDDPLIAQFQERIDQRHRDILREIDVIKAEMVSIEESLAFYTGVMTTSRRSNYLPQRPLRF